MKMKQFLPVALVGLLFVASCQNVDPGTGKTSVSSAGSGADVDSKLLANGTFDYTGASFEEKAKITSILEKYGMEKHLTGIPLYDDAGYTIFSDRLIKNLPTTTYITNYGFGVGNAKLTGEIMRTNSDGSTITVKETKDAWKPYYHSYTTVDSKTVNYWNSQGSDVADRNSMIAASYFGVKMNDTKDNFAWRGELSSEDRPIMLDGKGGNAVTDATKLKGTSKWWRVKLHHDDPKYVYTTKSTKYAAYNGQQIALDDYLTPFKAMMDGDLYRVSSLEASASGFTGVATYVNGSTKNWADVGIQANATEGSLDFEFITPKTSYYAMTNLSSTLFSPLPYNFVKGLGNTFAAGAKAYGSIGDSSVPSENCDNMLSCGPYTIDYWERDKEMVYGKNDSYFLGNEIQFPGMTEVVISGTSAGTLAFKAFLNGELDSVDIPSEEVKDYKNDAHALHTLGSTVLKMNVNSCTEYEWNYYFGENGTMYRHKTEKAWDIKPIMSNDDFLDGIYFSINRQELAELSGHNPAMGYLSNAYMYDPENGKAYRDSDAGKAAISDYTSQDEKGYGYNRQLAKQLFQKAITTLEANGEITPGTVSEPTPIDLKYFFRYDETIKSYGTQLGQYVTGAFNEACPNYKLTIDMSQAGSSYTDCYTKMDHGEYDMADGAITGNVLNPLEFMSCLCTDGLAQGFCLNWGEITAKVSKANDNPIQYDGKYWSYDGLYSAGNGKTIVTNGEANAPLSKGYYDNDNTYAIFACKIPDLTTDAGDPMITYKVSSLACFFANSLEFKDGTYEGYNLASAIGSNISVKRLDNYYAIYIKKSLLTQYAASVGKEIKMSINAIGVQVKVEYTIAGVSDVETVMWEVNLSDVGVEPFTYGA